jgi:5-methylthioadenosine/S-adenosylhomocysteine deaminase
MGERYDVIRGDFTYVDGELRPGLAVAFDPATGTITRVAPPEQLFGPDMGEEVVLAGRALFPGCVNVHSHAFQVLLRGRADDAPSFRRWVDEHMYPLVEALDDEDLETSMLLAFSDMVRHGVTTVGEFFYVHNGPGGARDGVDRAELAIRCARRVGLRVALVRTLYDQGGAPARERFREDPNEAIERTRALAGRWADDGHVSVLPAPHSLHGASAELIQAGHALAAQLHTRMHIHLAEQEHDLAFSRERYGTTPLRALDRLGVVTERLVIVHGCWLDAEEWEILGMRRGGLAYNPLANMFLGDGVTDIPYAVRAGVTVALGSDGPGGNNGVDPFAEMRMTALLQRATQRRMGVVAEAAHDARAELGPCPLFHMATVGGARNLSLRAGEIAPGMACDLIAVDYGDLALQPHHGLEVPTLLHNMIHTGATRSWLTDVVTGGRFTLRDRRLACVDEAELRERLRRWERSHAERPGPVPGWQPEPDGLP